MTGPAILMMIFSLMLVWGGLVMSVYNFATHPDEQDSPENSA